MDRRFSVPALMWKSAVFFLTVGYLLRAHRLLHTPEKITAPPLGRRPLPAGHRKVARVSCKWIHRLIGRRKQNYCILRSLTLWHLLRRYGVDVRLNISVAPQQKPGTGRLRGHGWLTLEGARFFDTVETVNPDALTFLGKSQKNQIDYWILNTQ